MERNADGDVLEVEQPAIITAVSFMCVLIAWTLIGLKTVEGQNSAKEFLLHDFTGIKCLDLSKTTTQQVCQSPVELQVMFVEDRKSIIARWEQDSETVQLVYVLAAERNCHYTSSLHGCTQNVCFIKENLHCLCQKLVCLTLRVTNTPQLMIVKRILSKCQDDAAQFLFHLLSI